MRLAVTAARVLLGVVFLVFGLNYFLGFIPQPPPGPAAGALLGAFVESGYLMTFIKVTEIVAGALLLAGRWVPLALVALVPITLNVFLFNLLLDPAVPGVVLGTAVLGLNAFLAWAYRAYYAPLKEARATPAVGERAPVGEPARA
jgi:uncharacterized membrane protein YphA (DoxX/SURF4 family)